jgi:hypothetical protein
VDTVLTVSVSADSAQAADFTAVDDFELTIPAGQWRVESSFTFEPVDDDVVELDETLTVSATTTALAVNTAQLTLTSEDYVTVSIEARGSVRIEGQRAAFKLTRDKQGGELSVDLEVSEEGEFISGEAPIAASSPMARTGPG